MIFSNDFFKIKNPTNIKRQMVKSFTLYKINKGNSMNKIRQAVLWAALVLIILLIILSIYGAFIGAEKARNFFNSLPLAIYWLALIVLLINGIVIFHSLARVPGLLFIHAGCILILFGAIWSSEAGHKLQKKLSGVDKISTGQMVIYEKSRENRVLLKNENKVKELPFYIALKDFRIEYYKPAYLQIQTEQGNRLRIPVEIGKNFDLSDNQGTIKILRAFENFKIRLEGDKYIPFEPGKAGFDPSHLRWPEPGYNPALEVQITSPEGNKYTKYVFERIPGHKHPKEKLFLRYQRAIREYISEVQVIENDKVAIEKNLEVNHPLHFGGYHFYQHSYDADAGQYTVLMVVSDTGLNLVYYGYLMLCIGVFWHLWLKNVFTALKAKNT